VCTPAALEALLPTLPDWGNVLVLLASTRRIPQLPDRLAALVRALAGAGCRRFRLQDLVKVLQRAARAAARDLMRSRAGTPVASRADEELTRPDDRLECYVESEGFEARCGRVRRRIEASGRQDARRNRLRVLEVCLPALRLGEWPSVREVSNLLFQAGVPVGHGTVGVSLREVKRFWMEEDR
jgi:hypothetical protein